MLDQVCGRLVRMFRATFHVRRLCWHQRTSFSFLFSRVKEINRQKPPISFVTSSGQRRWLPCVWRAYGWEKCVGRPWWWLLWAGARGKCCEIPFILFRCACSMCWNFWDAARIELGWILCCIESSCAKKLILDFSEMRIKLITQRNAE